MTSTRRPRSSSPPLPGLSRASTPDSSAPSTPVLPSAFLHSPKMSQQKPQVGFTTPATSSAYRIPGYDERSVMRAFASHAAYCSQCHDPRTTHRNGDILCQTGTALAKDLGKYFYCQDSKPFSKIDRDFRGGERVQVEVPADYEAVKKLFEALQRGLKFTNLRSKRPEVHHADTAPAHARAMSVPQNYEYTTAKSGSRRNRSNTYNGYSATVPDYETRTPFDEPYREEATARPRDSRRQSNRGSLYIADDRQSKRKSYVLPISTLLR